jgi:hypothetical protein
MLANDGSSSSGDSVASKKICANDPQRYRWRAQVALGQAGKLYGEPIASKPLGFIGKLAYS